MSSAVDPSTLTINTGDNAQGTFIFTNLQWNGDSFSGNAYNSLTKESGSVSGTEQWQAINATISLPGQTTSIYIPPPTNVQAEFSAMQNAMLQSF